MIICEFEQQGAEVPIRLSEDKEASRSFARFEFPFRGAQSSND